MGHSYLFSQKEEEAAFFLVSTERERASVGPAIQVRKLTTHYSHTHTHRHTRHIGTHTVSHTYNTHKHTHTDVLTNTHTQSALTFSHYVFNSFEENYQFGVFSANF